MKILVFILTLTIFDSISSSNVDKLMSKLRVMVEEKVNYPIFNFARELDTIYEGLEGRECETTLLDLELLYQCYMDTLRHYYWDRFVSATASASLRDLNELKHKMMLEFQTAAVRSTPQCGKDWNYEDILKELELDMLDYVNSVDTSERMRGDPNTDSDSHKDMGMEGDEEDIIFFLNRKSIFNSRMLSWVNPKWRKRSKWVVAKLLLVAFNMAQFEVQRRLNVRNAEKRLSAIPEFPLL